MNEGTPIIIKKRRKSHGHAHHGGSWKVAYADFVTAMMAFFMVMWIMGMSADTKSIVAGYFNDPNGFIKNPPKSRTPFAIPGSPSTKPGQGGDTMDMEEKERTEAKKIESSIEEAITADETLRGLFKNVEFSVSEEGMRIEFIEVSGSVFFESGRAVIRPEAKRLIAKVAPLLARSKRAMVIEGHTDAMPYAASDYDNLNLSTDRALSMKRALQAGGVTLKQLKQVRGYGDQKLRRPDKPLDFSNRRVTVLIPLNFDHGTGVELPADTIKNDVQGVFKQPIRVAPGTPDLREVH